MLKKDLKTSGVFSGKKFPKAEGTWVLSSEEKDSENVDFSHLIVLLVQLWTPILWLHFILFFGPLCRRRFKKSAGTQHCEQNWFQKYQFQGPTDPILLSEFQIKTYNLFTFLWILGLGLDIICHFLENILFTLGD